jgi:predicted permease
MLNYGNFLGGLLSCEVPYLIMLPFGYFFARQKILKRDGLEVFARLMIELLIPVYLFINVFRSTTVEIIQENYLIIISTLIYIFFAFSVGFLYAHFTHMDIRYKFTWFSILFITDVKLVHKLIIETFCFHLSDKLDKENKFCTNSLAYNYVHMFFQGIFTWYIAYNVIRRDRTYSRQIDAIVRTINDEHVDKDNPYIVKLSEEDRIQIKTAYEANKEKISEDFLNKVLPFVSSKVRTWKYKTTYVMLRPPVIAMFTGFIVGFITPIRAGFFDTKSTVFVRLY